MSSHLNFSGLIDGFNSGKKIQVSFKYPSENTLVKINSIISKILSREDRMYLLDTIITIIREITVNAVKANVKRIYFKKEGLDINNPSDYNEGMGKFMVKVMKHLADYKDDLTSSEYSINMYFYRENSGIYLRMINNCSILPVELEKISSRKEKAVEFDNFSEAYASFYDPEEGAGLGIILVVFLLRNAGIGPDMFRISRTKKTIAITIFIPDSIRKPEITSGIRERILEEVSTLPTFPENIMELQALCSKRDVSIDTISSRVRVDPSITADLLKLANSAGFYGGKRIETISEAIMRVGLKNIESMLAVTSTKKILDKRFKKFEQVWDHCNQVAFIARFIAIDYGYSPIADNVYVSGLLHDIGKIVLLSTEKELVDMISGIVDNSEIRTTTILEEVSLGISHATIGRMIAEKWNFPDYLIASIEHHHSPHNAENSYSDIVSIVYLANMLTGIDSDKYNFMYIENDILDRFNLDTQDKQHEYLEKIRNAYKKHKGIEQDTGQ